MDTNADNEQWMFLDVYYYARRDEIEDIENNIRHSGDGLENRMIAKDLLYKFQEYLITTTGRGFNLKNRLKDYTARPIQWNTQKHFKEFLKNES